MKTFILLGICLLSTTTIIAHQPVMDMAPRWAGGYGAQLRYEMLQKRQLVSGSEKVANTTNESDDFNKVWLEGIYTFTRAHRITLKVPYIAREKQGSNPGTNNGPGDVILGFPNKLYFNKKGMTGNGSITPSVKFPTGKTGDIDLGTGSFDFGASLSGSVETLRWYSLLDFFGWFNTKGDEDVRKGHVAGIDLDLGWHPYNDVQKSIGVIIMVSFNARYKGKDVLPDGSVDPNSGGSTLAIGPGVVYHQENIMLRAEYSVPAYRSLNGTQLAQSRKVTVGAGIVF